METPPGSILIVGSGVFGLSTAWSLAKNPTFKNTSITVIDDIQGDTVYPPPDAASIDSSRIIRADYADSLTSALAADAQREWRKQGEDDLGGQGRYTESGFILMAHNPKPGNVKIGRKSGLDYTKESWKNVQKLAGQDGFPADKIQELDGRDELNKIIGSDGHPGDWGYLNGFSGWADAEEGMRWLYREVTKTNRVKFVDGEVDNLVTEGKRVVGAKLKEGDVVKGDVVMVSAGAWTGALVDIRGQCEATAHALGYMDLSEEEAVVMRKQPVVLNLTSGLFAIPPKGKQLKIARHGFGYLNPQKITKALPRSHDLPVTDFVASRPWTSRDGGMGLWPKEAEADLRRAMRDLVPIKGLEGRPWTYTRLCWYSDTPNGDWLVDWHPGWEGLFIATGDSGHGYKFLPVLGDKVLECMLGKGGELGQKWKWKKEDGTAGREIDGVYNGLITEDGSRGGLPGLILADELKKS